MLTALRDEERMKAEGELREAELAFDLVMSTPMSTRFAQRSSTFEPEREIQEQPYM